MNIAILPADRLRTIVASSLRDCRRTADRAALADRMLRLVLDTSDRLLYWATVLPR